MKYAASALSLKKDSPNIAAATFGSMPLLRGPLS